MKKLVSILVHAQSENKSESVNLTAGETVINPQSSKFVEHYLNAHSTLAEKTMLYRQCRKSQKAHTPRKEAVLRYGLFRKFVVLMYQTYRQPGRCPAGPRRQVLPQALRRWQRQLLQSLQRLFRQGRRPVGAACRLAPHGHGQASQRR
jgi:hypothetical protein